MLQQLLLNQDNYKKSVMHNYIGNTTYQMKIKDHRANCYYLYLDSITPTVINTTELHLTSNFPS